MPPSPESAAYKEQEKKRNDDGMNVALAIYLCSYAWLYALGHGVWAWVVLIYAVCHAVSRNSND